MAKEVAAFFDVDGTILPHTSTERLFIKYLLKKGELTWVALGGLERSFFSSIDKGIIKAIKGNKGYMKDFSVQRAEKLGRECFQRIIRPRISDEAKRRIRRHMTNNEKVVFISGTLDFLLDYIVEHFEGSTGFSTELEKRDGRFTGLKSSLFPYREAKLRIVNRFSQNNNISLEDSYGYGNHLTDLFFLTRVGNPFAVNPRIELEKAANKFDIPVVYWE